jgi:hypothetical protein
MKAIYIGKNLFDVVMARGEEEAAMAVARSRALEQGLTPEDVSTRDVAYLEDAPNVLPETDPSEAGHTAAQSGAGPESAGPASGAEKPDPEAEARAIRERQLAMDR